MRDIRNFDCVFELSDKDIDWKKSMTLDEVAAKLIASLVQCVKELDARLQALEAKENGDGQ